MQILNAVTQYTSEEGNAITDFAGIRACDDLLGPSSIGTTGVKLAGPTPTDGLVEEFLVEIPRDPSVGTEEVTGYTICVTAGGRVQIDGPNAEDGKIISVKR